MAMVGIRICVSGLLALVMSFSSLAGEEILRIGTGSENGVYYPVGQAICRTVTRYQVWGAQGCLAETSKGSVANIEALRSGEKQFAIVQADWQYFAFIAAHEFNDISPFLDLRAVFSLHAEPFTVIARRDSGIRHFSQLPGKRVNIGNPGSGQRATMEVVMQGMGWDKSTFLKASELDAKGQILALCKGEIDAMVYTVGHPSEAIKAVTMGCDSVVVEVSGDEINALIRKHNFYRPDVVPGGIYRGNPQDVKTFAVGATLVTSAAVDSDTVYRLVEAVFSRFSAFKRLHPVFAPLSAESMARQGIFVPLHPGAQKYFRETGLER